MLQTCTAAPALAGFLFFPSNRQHNSCQENTGNLNNPFSRPNTTTATKVLHGCSCSRPMLSKTHSTNLLRAAHELEQHALRLCTQTSQVRRRAKPAAAANRKSRHEMHADLRTHATLEKPGMPCYHGRVFFQTRTRMSELLESITAPCTPPRPIHSPACTWAKKHQSASQSTLLQPRRNALRHG
jgi:hypothetical protein